MRILLGLSGGVDSTYAAVKLINDGHEVEGAVVLMHEYTSVDEARESAESIGIPLHVIDCREQFKSIVEENFIREYERGRTPNPCVVCNSEVKFIYLLRYAEENGFDRIATGHYASVEERSDEFGSFFGIRRGIDAKKDQSYMLWRLPQTVLSKLSLPLSDMTKSEVRNETSEHKLKAADRPDSQEICFLPNGDYAEFIESRLGAFPQGDFLDEDGNILGKHRGIIRYTVGQRRGLGISSSARLFVTDINVKNNTVTLSHNDSYSTSVRVSGIVYSGMREPSYGEERNLEVKLRYAARPTGSRVRFFGDFAEVELEAPVRAVTPGQSAVFYDGNLLVAGGFIDSLSMDDK
jgi:tRNA-specific 2-thiouridylase